MRRAHGGALRDWSIATVVPAVAIGGGTPANCGELAAAGADFVATVSGVWEHPGGPGEAVEAFNAALVEAAPRG